MKTIIKKMFFSKYLYPVCRRVFSFGLRFARVESTRAMLEYLNQLNLSEHATLDDLEALQTSKLKRLIREVYENVPYYREIMKQKHLTPLDIHSLDDLKAFPILTKHQVRENFDHLRNVRYNKSELTLITTGGTTGTPMKFYNSEHEKVVRTAHYERWKKFAGVNRLDRFMYIGMDANAKDNPNYDGSITLSGYYLMASFGLNDERMSKYWERIKWFKPLYLRGYASACYILAEFLLKNSFTYPLKAVLTSSDTLYPQQRSAIEEAFSCPVFDHYGQNEDIVTATECQYHDGYHINMESSIVEIVDEDGCSVPPGRTGIIVGTHLENYCMPLIRYNTMDLGCLTSDKCPCNREHARIKELFGRQDDIIITPDGKQIGCGSMNQPMKKLYDQILETQFIQEESDTLVVKFVPTSKFTPESEKEFEKEIRAQVGNLMKIKFEKVSAIPKTNSGKHRLIIVKVK